MTKKTKRTEIKDLSVTEKALTKQEASQVKGGLRVDDPGDERPKNPVKPKGGK